MSSANLINVEFGLWAVEIWVDNEYNSDDRTQPCGVVVNKNVGRIVIASACGNIKGIIGIVITKVLTLQT